MSDGDQERQTSLILYGHPFSSYTWKVLIALYSESLEFDFRIVDRDHPAHVEEVRAASPLGKFPVLEDGENQLFEATTIIEYLARHHGSSQMLVPADGDAAIGMRMLDRVFDNYVMTPMQVIVDEHIRAPDSPDADRIAEAKARLDKSYAWLEGWLEYYPPMDHVTLIECAAAPALFYADWVHPIADSRPRLQRWLQHLMRLPAVARCMEGAEPYAPMFPPGPRPEA